MWTGSCLGVQKAPGEKLQFVKWETSTVGWLETSGFWSDRQEAFWETKTKTSPESERAFIGDSWEEYMQILQECQKVVSSFHVHRQLDHFVFVYPTTLSSSHGSLMASSRVSMILFKHEVTNFQVHLKTQAGALWNVSLCFCVSLSVEVFALGLKRHNTKECKVRPHHDTHIVVLPAQGGLHTNTLPTPCNETGDRALCRSKHNRDSISDSKSWIHPCMHQTRANFIQ